jgi:hypothetical protein
MSTRQKIRPETGGGNTERGTGQYEGWLIRFLPGCSFHAVHCSDSFHRLNYVVKAPGYVPVIVLPVRNNAMAAIFDSAGIRKPATTLIPKSIQRAVAKQTVEFIGINPSVAGEEFAFPVSEESKRLSVPVFALWLLCL